MLFLSRQKLLQNKYSSVAFKINKNMSKYGNIKKQAKSRSSSKFANIFRSQNVLKIEWCMVMWYAFWLLLSLSKYTFTLWKSASLFKSESQPFEVLESSNTCHTKFSFWVREGDHCVQCGRGEISIAAPLPEREETVVALSSLVAAQRTHPHPKESLQQSKTRNLVLCLRGSTDKKSLG